MATLARQLVSKKKKRFKQKEGGFDLDLSYITPRVIAMGFPSQGAEGLYRNPLKEVQRFFNTRHPGHYKIYNLCAERDYALTGLFEKVEHFGFKDHNPCPFRMMEIFCESVDAFLDANDKNVVGIHCKAGKGRTGTCIAAYLVHKLFDDSMTADKALAIFAEERTHNKKGVTIPSQMRYVHYYEQAKLRGKVVPYEYQITHIRMVTVPEFDTFGGCRPYFKVKSMWLGAGGKLEEETLFNYWDKCTEAGQKPRSFKRLDPFVDLDCSAHDLVVSGDVCLVFFDHDDITADEKMCQIWFHTGFIENHYLSFEKSAIDKAVKDKKHKQFDANFKIEVYLKRLQ